MVAYALSRIDEGAEAQLLILSFPQFEFMAQLCEMLLISLAFQNKMALISANPVAYPNYQVQNDMLLYKGSIWLNDDKTFIPALLIEFHATPLGGHFSVAKTTRHIQASFIWDHLWRDVKTFIWNCATCQQVKHVTC